MDDILEAMKEAGYHYEILFLDADSNVLIKRYKETRRNHPLALQGRVDKAIEAERKELAPDIPVTITKRIITTAFLFIIFTSNSNDT